MNTEIIKEINVKFIQQFHMINILLKLNSVILQIIILLLIVAK